MNSRNFTPNNSTIDNFEMFMVTETSGDVSIDYEGGNSRVLTSVPVGVWIPCGHAIRIRATGTTASGLLVA